MYGEILIIS